MKYHITSSARQASPDAPTFATRREARNALRDAAACCLRTYLPIHRQAVCRSLGDDIKEIRGGDEHDSPVLERLEVDTVEAPAGRIYTCVGFTGHYPVGVAAVVRATSPEQASEILNAQLRKQGLRGDAESRDMTPFPDDDEDVRVLCDGDY